VRLRAAVRSDAPAGLDRSAPGTVLLATFNVPFDPAAAHFAVDSAVETGSRLVVANVVELEPLPMSVQLGVDTVDYPAELAESLVEPARLAQSLGIKVERLRVRSFRRVEALIEIAKERDVRLLVLGPDRRRVKRRLYDKAAAAVRDQLSCLVWLSWDVKDLKDVPPG
jgi:nucleotide-binding universal stress UspA family protein